MADTNYKWDVFICHASEDKVAIVTPLYNQLKKSGLKNIWYDKESMYAGDNIVEKVKEGLNNSLIVVLVASKDSLDKNFPRMEIGGVLFNPKEIGDRLIPLRYKISREDVLKKINVYGDLFNLQVGDVENAYKKELKAAVNDIIKKVKITKKEREQQIKREKRIRSFRIIKYSGAALTFTLTILLSVFLYSKLPINKRSNDYIYSITPFDTTKSSYNVLLFPFQPLEMCRFKKTNIELTIISRLFDLAKKDSLNLSIKYDTLDCIHSSTEAEAIGEKLNANLIIWGDLYEHCTIDNEASLRFVNISSESSVPGLDLKGESGIERISSLSEIKEGKLQQNTDYIIYWVAASRSFAKKNFTKALYYFLKIESSYTVTDELHLFIGSCYHSIKSFEEAKVHYEKALKINPNYALAHNNYATLLEGLNDPIGAKAHYMKALEIDPSFERAYNNYARFLEGSNDPNEAKEHYEKALKINPNYALAQCNYAHFLERLNDPNGAKEHYEKALKINPNYALAHNNYAYCLEVLNDPNGAKEHYEKALEIDPNSAQVHNNYASLLERKFNDFKKAKEHYARALKINPNLAEVHYNYAIILHEKFNDIEEAKKHYLNAIKLKPDIREKDLDDFFGVR